jgi:hypothetical protein
VRVQTGRGPLAIFCRETHVFPTWEHKLSTMMTQSCDPEASFKAFCGGIFS